MADLRLDELSLDGIRSEGFSRATRPWIERLANELADSLGEGDHSFETAATLFFLLRHLPDGEFPGGKWATIQHLEGMLDGEARAALARLGVTPA